MTVKITVTDPESGEALLLAEGDIGVGVTEAGDSYYFQPVAVNDEILQENPDETRSDEVGLGKYYDVISPVSRGVVKTMVAWVYQEVQEDYDEVAGMYGFPRVDSGGVIVQVTDAEGNDMQDKLDEVSASAISPSV